MARAFLLRLFFLVILAGQSGSSPNQAFAPKAVHLDSGKPTVYITCDKKEDRAGEKRIWLTIHNNSIFDLSFGTYGMQAPESPEIHPRISVQSSGRFKHEGNKWKWVGPHAPVFETPDIVGEYILKSGATTQFVAPAEYLAKGLWISLSFKFPSEDNWPQTEPWHQISYEDEN